MYAIIRTGGKQTKVHEGDVIDVEHLRAEGEIGFAPLLLVDDAGAVFSHRDALKGARVVARVVGESAGPKVDLFKYKAKTGYRRHQGHRQRYTTLEVVRIDLPEGAKRNPPAEKPVEPAPTASAAAPESAKPAAKAPRTAKPAAKVPRTAKPAAKAPAESAKSRDSAAKTPAERKKKKES
jgi:large subunit ribosomal protein L21